MKKQEKDNYLTISEFSRISEIKRKALIFYDNTGVFSPKYTAPNGYRYYTHDQIYVIAVVNLLKELGMPLSEIKEYTANISPENAISLLKEQERNLVSKIQELQSIQDMLGMKLQKLEEGVSARVDGVQIQCFKKFPFSSAILSWQTVNLFLMIYGLIFIQSVSKIMFLLAIRKDIS